VDARLFIDERKTALREQYSFLNVPMEIVCVDAICSPLINQRCIKTLASALNFPGNGGRKFGIIFLFWTSVPFWEFPNK